MRLFPSTIMGRTMGIVLLGFVLAGTVMVGQVYVERQTMLANIGGWHVVSRIAGVVKLLEKTPTMGRQAALRAFQGPVFRVSWSRQSLLSAEPLDWRGQLIKDALAEQLGPIQDGDLRLGETPRIKRLNQQMMDRMHGPNGLAAGSHGGMPGGMGRRHLMMVALKLPDSSWLNFTTTSAPIEPVWTSRFFWPGFLSLVLVVLASAWAVGRATQPLSVFAQAAERLGLDFNAKPLTKLAEEGPREVRRAAKAFNLMQHRLQAFVKDRTHMLAAISHDLRTPITRLKLRAEFVDDAQQRRKMLADLDEMEAMIAATLRFARDDATNEPAIDLDLAALVRGVAEGMGVTCKLPKHLSYSGRPIGLKRMVGNLINNANAFASIVEVELDEIEGAVVLTVRDDGPGIADDMLSQVFDPFVRVENSRSRDTGGTGLGLAAVKSIAQAHGGTVELVNLEKGGLEARVTLPR